MKRENERPEPRKHDARRGYRQARQLKRGAAGAVHAVPNCIIGRGGR